MNERLLELTKAATNPDYDGDSGPMNEVNLEKFAELIVEECVAQCWTVSELEHKGQVLSECSKRIRKHFGVEE